MRFGEIVGESPRRSDSLGTEAQAVEGKTNNICSRQIALGQIVETRQDIRVQRVFSTD